MPEAGPDAASKDAAWMKQALHDLSQPLTALECGLFIGTISPDGIRAPTAEELLQTILAGLQQCERIANQVRTIRDRMNGMDANEIGSEEAERNRRHEWK